MLPSGAGRCRPVTPGDTCNGRSGVSTLWCVRPFILCGQVDRYKETGSQEGTGQRESKAQPAKTSTNTTKSPNPVHPSRKKGTPRVLGTALYVVVGLVPPGNTVRVPRLAWYGKRIRWRREGRLCVTARGLRGVCAGRDAAVRGCTDTVLHATREGNSRL